MTDSTLSLAARLAANLFVDALKLAKPGARLAAKVGDRLLGGSPFNEREAQRFLTAGGSEAFHASGPAEWVGPTPTIPNGPAYRIGAFDDPNADVHLCKTWDGQCHCSTAPSHDQAERVHQTMASACRAIDELITCGVETGHDMGLSAAAEMFPQHTKIHPTGAGLARAPGTGGVQTPASQGEQPVGVGVSGPGADGSETRIERQERVVLEMLVADVLAEHHFCQGISGIAHVCRCGINPLNIRDWRAHISELVIQALQK